MRQILSPSGRSTFHDWPTRPESKAGFYRARFGPMRVDRRMALVERFIALCDVHPKTTRKGRAIRAVVIALCYGSSARTAREQYVLAMRRVGPDWVGADGTMYEMKTFNNERYRK
jgi:hypothetical protein